jgi:hypothetical protein
VAQVVCGVAVVSEAVVVATASLPFTRDIDPVFKSLASDEVESIDITDSPEACAICIAWYFG